MIVVGIRLSCQLMESAIVTIIVIVIISNSDSKSNSDNK